MLGEKLQNKYIDQVISDPPSGQGWAAKSKCGILLVHRAVPG